MANEYQSKSMCSFTSYNYYPL